MLFIEAENLTKVTINCIHNAPKFLYDISLDHWLWFTFFLKHFTPSRFLIIVVFFLQFLFGLRKNILETEEEENFSERLTNILIFYDC